MAESIGSKLNISREQVREARRGVGSGDDVTIGARAPRCEEPHAVCGTAVCVQAQHFCQMYLPGIARSESEVSVGRISLGRKQTESVQLSV